MNISDSERIAGFLELHKLKPAENINEANLVIFNTCGVRQMAEDRVFGQIHNLTRNTQHETRSKFIVLTGCLANRKDVHKRLKDKVDLFFPINEFDKFENWIFENFLNPPAGGENCKLKIPAQLNNTNYSNYLSIVPKYTNKHTAYVPVMTGCNNFCAYCVVPYARGREISRPAEEIISEIKGLIKNGCKEIILLGQNVNSYNHVTYNTKHVTITPFPKLLKMIEKIPGKFWISFMSSHPKDYSDELIDVIAKSKKICEMVHLPLQAGDDKILEKMNRKYTKKHYLSLVKKIKFAFKKYKPETLYSITTDIIVGFPGETKKQFLESADVMKKVKYDMVFFGQFSPRPGTAAYKLTDNVSKAEKVKRENFLNEILKKTNLANNKKYVGKVLEVIIDKFEAKPQVYFARTRTGKHMRIESKKKDLVGQFAKVKITKANIWNLEGEITK